MRRYSMSYLASQAFKSLARNSMMTLISVAILVSCLVVMGSFALLVMNINHNLDKLGDMNQVVVFCKVGLDDDTIDGIGNTIRALDNVDEKKVEFISNETALLQEKQKYADSADIFIGMEQEGENPYPDSFVITYEDADKVEALEYELTQIEGVEKVKCRADLAQTIENLKHGIILIFVWFLAILFLVSVFVIINTIKLAVFSRRQEITIMRYVGATRSFITTPFVFEGILIGLVSSGLSFVIEMYTYNTITEMIGAEYSMLTFMPFASVRLEMLITFLVVGVVTGIIGSIISLRKYLKA